MEESVNQENQQATPPPVSEPQEEQKQTYQFYYETSGGYYSSDGIDFLTLMAYIILVFGIILAIWSFATFSHVENIYPVEDNWGKIRYKTEEEFSINGLVIALAIVLSTIIIYNLLIDISNISTTLKDIQHKMAVGRITIAKQPQRQSTYRGEGRTESTDNLVYPDGDDYNSKPIVKACIAIFIIVLFLVIMIIKVQS